jgi:glutaredoxin 3
VSKKIEIYTWGYCPYCIRAKNLLDEKGMAFTEISLDGKDEELTKLRERTGQRTVPQIFIDDEFIGGFSELSALNEAGKL